MSWKASLSRHLPVLRFFACPKSPSSRGIIGWYTKNYGELNHLNPTMPLLMRCTENAMPAITTEIDFTTADLLKYMIQSNKFQNTDGSVAADRVEAAEAYLSRDDLSVLASDRWNSTGFDPERPFLDEDDPDWRSDPKIAKDLEGYLKVRDGLEEQLRTIKSGPNGEFTRAENALLMCQRVDLWCAGESEVEAAVKHLLNLGKKCNDLESDNPEYITEFYPGADDL